MIEWGGKPHDTSNSQSPSQPPPQEKRNRPQEPEKNGQKNRRHDGDPGRPQVSGLRLGLRLGLRSILGLEWGGTLGLPLEVLATHNLTLLSTLLSNYHLHLNLQH